MKNKKNTNLIAVLAYTEIEELAIEGQVQNALNLNALEISKNSKNKKTN